MSKTITVPKVLTIAGSDCGGGAGIQADIKTISALGCHASTAITAITVQDTCKVHDILPITANIIEGQIKTVLNDLGADAIKTGMLLNEQIIRMVIKSLSSYKKIPLVVDPVMVATSGDSLFNNNALAALKELIALSFLVTPNLPEAEILAGIKIENDENIKQAACNIMKLGAQAVLIKGGHSNKDIITDWLFYEDKEIAYTGKRITINNKKFHGTGCTLSAAIASYLALGKNIETAVAMARDFLNQALCLPLCIGNGSFILKHFNQ